MTLKWEAGVAWSAVTITLNSVANGSIAIGSTVIANGTDLNLRLDASLILGSLTPGTGGYVELHLIPLTHDGTNYADAPISGACMVAALPLSTGASIKYAAFMPPRCWLEIPPGSFKLGIGNRAGVSFAGSGNALQYRTYRLG